MKHIALLIGVCILTLSVNAQTDVDALRYSQLTFGGTARGMGLAGAVGSLGADVTDLSINPAGLGLFHTSELEITPSLYSLSYKTGYFGTPSTSNNTNFNLTNVGAVFTRPVRQRRRGPSTLWKSTGFALALNRLNNFNGSFYYQGFNPNSSLVNSFVQTLNANGGTPPSQAYNNFGFDAGLAYETYLVNPNSNSDSLHYYGVVNGNEQQSQQVNTSGAQNEFDISFGANYNDKLYFGITLGIPTINYNYTSVYNEMSVNNSVPGFQNFSYFQNLSTNGDGINAKFGIIYKVNDFFRFGVALHTPTWYSMQDNYNSSMSSTLDTNGTLASFQFSSPYGQYNYALITPWRAIASATVLFKKAGFISADYEYVDYSSMHFDFSSSGSASDLLYQNQVNQTIQNKYGGASIVRIGGELAYDIFRFRAGFAWYGSPFQSNAVSYGGDLSSDNITLGLGIRQDHFFVDAAYVYSMSNSTYYPYSLDSTQPPFASSPYATVQSTSGNIVLTVGYKF